MANLKAQIAEIVEQRQMQRRGRLLRRKEEVFAKLPRIKEIEERLDSTGLKLMSQVADGGLTAEEAVEKIMAENRAFVSERTQLLASAGYGADYLNDRPICDRCGDTGYVNGRPCPCVIAKMDKELAAQANLSEKMTAQTFDRFRLDCYSDLPDPVIGVSPRDNMVSVFNTCLKFVDDFSSSDENLFLTGTSGLGKTYLSSAVANELIARGEDVLYVSANTLFTILEDLHFNRSVSEGSRYLVDHVFSARLLILDDLGSEFVTQFTAAELFRIVNNRLLDGKKTIISTNLSISEIEKQYSQRLHSRIVGGYTILKFYGEDIRIKSGNI